MQKVTPDELVAYSSINLLTLERCHNSRLAVTPTVNEISYQHLWCWWQTIDCWLLWEERKIIK